MIGAVINRFMENIRSAIKRIIEQRDFSMQAAAALESAIAQQMPEDERFEELTHILASYRPGGGELLFGEKELAAECERIFKLIKRCA